MKSSLRTTLAGVVALLVSVPVHAQVADSAARRQQRALDSLATVIQGMQAKMDSLSSATPAPAPAAPAAQPGRAAGAYMNVSFVGLTDVGWSTERDVASLQVGDHDPHVRGFSIPN